MRPSRIPRLSRSERYGEVKYVARHTVLGGKTKQEWSLNIAIQGLENICKAKKASHAPRKFAQGLRGRRNSHLTVMTNTLQEWKCQSTASAAGITRKLAGLAAAVIPEEDDEDDDGPVGLTGAYKSLEIDVQRLKERLRYYSKKWEIKIIAISEEDRRATENREAGFTRDASDKQKETAAINDHEKESQKGVQVSSDTKCELAKQEATQHALQTHESPATYVTMISAGFVQEANDLERKVTSKEQLMDILARSNSGGKDHTTICTLVFRDNRWRGKLASATKRYARLVFDPGGNLSSRQKKDGLYSIYYA